jgi:hypothetical protein
VAAARAGLARGGLHPGDLLRHPITGIPAITWMGMRSSRRVIDHGARVPAGFGAGCGRGGRGRVPRIDTRRGIQPANFHDRERIAPRSVKKSSPGTGASGSVTHLVAVTTDVGWPPAAACGKPGISGASQPAAGATKRLCDVGSPAGGQTSHNNSMWWAPGRIAVSAGERYRHERFGTEPVFTIAAVRLRLFTC